MRWYKDEQLIRNSVKESYRYAQVLRKVGVKDTGSNYNTLKKALSKFNIEFIPDRNFNYNREFRKLPTDKILVKNSTYGATNRLKERLIKEGLFVHKCYRCGRTEWNGEKIPIQIEHIDGDRTNNTIENLTILCPNCHAQTPTYCRSKKGRKYKEAMLLKEAVFSKNGMVSRSQKQSKQLVKDSISKDRLDTISSRLSDLVFFDTTKFGWVQKLADKWEVSHSQVRRFLRKNKPDIFLSAVQRKPKNRW